MQRYVFVIGGYVDASSDEHVQFILDELHRAFKTRFPSNIPANVAEDDEEWVAAFDLDARISEDLF